MCCLIFDSQRVIFSDIQVVVMGQLKERVELMAGMVEILSVKVWTFECDLLKKSTKLFILSIIISFFLLSGAMSVTSSNRKWAV